ncbi:hypothetical protein BAnh1_08500 [Bartonella australis AUST/NH1]|uniref:Uncharacterized protein n=1 Tax=Bartonella australis (strain Aust/NH1) TaxID=1094489 RepID=M1PDQ3_BARAA|nr:hypothetical protein [Bartonella australis]AGF74726.1 hypothetical protein BAnh1_08500 [Bartonella australis AUST/NH1]
MKLRWRRTIILILFISLIFVSAFLVYRVFLSYQFVFNGNSLSQQVNLTEDILLERPAVSAPDAIEKISKMSVQQKRQIIEQARRDAIAAASASGQNNEQAQKFGHVAAEAISKAINHPSAGAS